MMFYHTEGVQRVNRNTAEVRTEYIVDSELPAVIAQLTRMGEGLRNPRVEVASDPDSHGGFNSEFLIVYGDLDV